MVPPNGHGLEPLREVPIEELPVGQEDPGDPYDPEGVCSEHLLEGKGIDTDNSHQHRERQ